MKIAVTNKTSMTDVSQGSSTAPRQLPRRTLNLSSFVRDEGKARVFLFSSALTRPSFRSRSKDAATASSTPSTRKYRALKPNIIIKSTCSSYVATSRLFAIIQIFDAWPSPTNIKSSRIFTSRWAVFSVHLLPRSTYPLPKILLWSKDRSNPYHRHRRES